jgi:hypothetical protein
MTTLLHVLGNELAECRDMPLFQPECFHQQSSNGRQWNGRVDQIFGDGSNRIYANYLMTLARAARSASGVRHQSAR